MKTVALSTAILLVAGAAAAQTAPSTPAQTPPNTLTRDLNSGPPAAATYLAPAPTASPTPATASAPPATATPRPAPAPANAAPAASAPRPVAPRPVAAPPATATPAPRPVAPAAGPAAPAPRAASPVAASTPPPASATPAPAPAPAAAPAPPPPAPAVSTVTVLDAAARAALPFAVDLPRGFELVTGRPGPNFRIYTIRRGERSFVMVYTGPNSQFPIYSGDQVEIPGRSSIVATEDGQRHAMEHLFRRATDPLEVHVWTMTLDGADRALAEQIAQSVETR